MNIEQRLKIFNLPMNRLTRVSEKLILFQRDRKQRRRARAVRERIHYILNTVESVSISNDTPPVPEDSQLFTMLPEWMVADAGCHQAWGDWFDVLRRSDVETKLILSKFTCIISGTLIWG